MFEATDGSAPGRKRESTSNTAPGKDVDNIIFLGANEDTYVPGS